MGFSGQWQIFRRPRGMMSVPGRADLASARSPHGVGPIPVSPSRADGYVTATPGEVSRPPVYHGTCGLPTCSV